MSLKTRPFGINGGVPTPDAAPSQATLVVSQSQRRHPVIRRHDLFDGVLQGLPLVDQTTELPSITRPRDFTFVAEQTAGQRGAGAREITPIVVVAHAVQIPAGTGLAPKAPIIQDIPNWQGMVVLIRKSPALIPGTQAVIGHVGGPQHTARLGRQVAVLSGVIDAAIAHDRGVKSRVLVGGNVPIPRQAELHATEVVDVDRGW